MAAAPVIVTHTNEDTPAVGGLFAGLSFFLVQRLPSRSSFVEKIQSNGGRVVRLEDQADHVIADHFRRDCPNGSLSYTFIDTAIQNGELPDPNNHLAGARPGALREIGSAIPGKSTRTPFTAEDDKTLWQWVERCKRDGAQVKGNEIYKQLEARNPRHTYQAWRDRYVKRLIDKPPAGVELTIAANPPPSPPTAQDDQQEISGEAVDQAQGEDSPTENTNLQNSEPEFTEEDLEFLMKQAKDIEKVVEESMDDAWGAWAQTYPEHSADSWRKFWTEHVRPVYLQRKATRKAKRKRERGLNVEIASVEAILDQESNSTPSEEEQAPTTLERTPNGPSSSGSQKRKRSSLTSRVKRMYSLKKLKSGSGDDLGQDESNKEVAPDVERTDLQSPPKLSTQPVELLGSDDEEEAEAEQIVPTSELNRAAQAQLEREEEEEIDGLMLRERISDAQADAQAEFDEEVFGIPRSNAAFNYNSMSNLPTSEVNRAAGQQLMHESIDRQHETEVDDNDDLPLPSELPAPETNHAQVADDPPVNVFEPQVDALTEENLASQQALHRSQIFRGADLPEDDDARDGEIQDRYVQFLQSITSESRPAQAFTAESLQRQREYNIEPPTHETQYPSNMLQIGHDDMNTEQIEELPVASQEEIDGAIDDIIQWPESPTISQRKEAALRPSQSFGYETHVPYPELPSQRPGPSLREGQEIISSQNSAPSQIAYPALPQQPPEPINTSSARFAEQLPSSQPPFSDEQRSVESDSSYVLVQEDPHPRSSEHEPGEDELDLSIAVPDGGWDPSSSPAKVLKPSPVHQLRSQQNDHGRPNSHLAEEPDVDAEAVAENRDVVELTSSPSSSSSDSASEPAAPADDGTGERKRALETQDIVNAETQQPDFDMPLPPDSDQEYDDLRSGPTNQPSSPPNAVTIESQRALATTHTLPDDDLDSYIDTMVVRGYNEVSVINALRCTSMRPDLAELVLLEEKAGKGLPKDVAGVWSEEDDRVVESGNARGLRKLEEKHSWKEVESRMLFLEEWREDE